MRLCVATVELFPSWRALDRTTIKAKHYFPFQSSEEVLSLSEGREGRTAAGDEGGTRKKGLSLRKSYRRFDERSRVLTKSLK